MSMLINSKLVINKVVIKIILIIIGVYKAGGIFVKELTKKNLFYRHPPAFCSTPNHFLCTPMLIN